LYFFWNWRIEYGRQRFVLCVVTGLCLLLANHKAVKREKRRRGSLERRGENNLRFFNLAFGVL